MTGQRSTRLQRQTVFRRPARRLAAFAALAMGIAALAGCKSQTTGAIATDGYRTRHPIVLAEAPETFDIPVGSATRTLAPSLARKVRAFGRDALKRGDGGVEILVPAGSANETAAISVARQIHAELTAAGVPRGVISPLTYRVDDPLVEAPIRISYLRMQAMTDRCGVWRDDLTARHQNNGYDEFGCSTQSNLAAMVADPTDLIQPRAATPGDPARRGVVFDKFRKGEKTATDYGDDNSGNVAKVGG
ncbi:CpaD family pilus assembly protein [Rhodobium gokarnense]|uniref:Pilus assembly protein CpaD n=1 Tax=Rhodobium gokarnense TaxID=364296 RepID=A0ABT3H7Z2_9HYPH|nr:CpaD family pilus assembly protein [Rhodobium gokarnense]MCW2306517.1 pilus assembly protein CpaD [Rhodobium gokarnense]